MRNVLISTLQEMDTTYWSGQQGGIAPIPQYAMAIAQAVSTNNGTAHASHCASSSGDVYMYVCTVRQFLFRVEVVVEVEEIN